MKRRTLFSLILLAVAAWLLHPVQLCHAAKLLQQEDLLYLGAFRLPGGNFGCSQQSYCSFHYGGSALAYNPGRDSLFVVGHAWHQQVAEVKIPGVVRSERLQDLETATVLQPFVDPTEGHRSELGAGGATVANGAQLGGLLVYGGRLVGSSFAWYDAAYAAKTSHFTSAVNWSKEGTRFAGMYKVGEAPVVPGAGFVSGYLAEIPPEWRQRLGGPVLTGNGALNIITRTSYGPAAFVFDPGELGKKKPAPAQPLVYYPAAHATLGGYRSSGRYFNGASQVKGLVFPRGTRSILFFGRQGAGPFCYGVGTSDARQAGAAEAGKEKYCFDPSSSDKGTHAFPYVYQIWAYDAAELLTVREGRRLPWEVKPYDVWRFNLPFQPANRIIMGVAYDPASQRVFVSQRSGDGSLPVIHVFKVALPSSR